MRIPAKAFYGRPESFGIFGATVEVGEPLSFPMAIYFFVDFLVEALESKKYSVISIPDFARSTTAPNDELMADAPVLVGNIQNIFGLKIGSRHFCNHTFLKSVVAEEYTHFQTEKNTVKIHVQKFFLKQ